MTLSRFQVGVISVWWIGLLLFVGLSVAMGAPITVGGSVFLLVIGFALPAVVLIVFRGAPQRSLGRDLYDQEFTSKEIAERLRAIGGTADDGGHVQ